MQPLMVDPTNLKPNPWNTNSVAEPEMAKLRKSIGDLGFVTAVVVRELSDGTLEILGGQHRTQAAIEIGLKSVPVLNLGHVDDTRAKKIGLVDNARYGADDTLSLAQLLEEIGLDREELTSFLPMDEDEIEQVFKAVDIDLDGLDFVAGEDDEIEIEEDAAQPKERPKPTHTMMRFRLTNADAEAVSRIIEKTITRESINDGDDATNAGSALAHLLLNN